MFERLMQAGWGDMDFNSHMRNTAYLDKAADLRMIFFAENGFPMSEFKQLKIGPVILKDEIEYFREVNLLDELKVTLALAGMAEDGSRWLMQNEFFRAAGKQVARVLSSEAWLDLTARKLILPPPALGKALDLLSRTTGFIQLTSSIK